MTEHRTPLICESAITAVVAYRRGALVTRGVALDEIDLPTSRLELALTGITPLAEASSLRASCTGREILQVSSDWAIPAEGPLRGGLSAERRALEQKITAVKEKLATLAERRTVVEALRLKSKNRRARRDWRSPSDRVHAALAVASLSNGLTTEVDDEVLVQQAILREVQRELMAIDVRGDQSPASDRVGSGHPTRTIVVALGPGERLDGLLVTYSVPTVRWWPAYSARLTDNGQRAALTIEAFVAQNTLEDWSAVELTLCTADLRRSIQLPELPSLRLGRTQPQERRGYREPPAGLEALFAAYDRVAGALPAKSGLVTPTSTTTALALSDLKPAEPEPVDARGDAFTGAPEGDGLLDISALAMAGDWDEGPAREMAKSIVPVAGKRSAGLLRAAAAVVVAPAAAGAAAASWAVQQSKKKRDTSAPGRGRAAHEPEGGPLDVSSWLDYDRLWLADPAKPSGQRGSLEPIREPASARGLASASEALEQLSPPAGCVDPQASAGAFAYRFAAEARVDVPANGRTHRLELQRADADSQTNLVCVPNQTPDVYREITLKNPFDAPLLAGPIDVFFDGALLTSDHLQTSDRGGTVRFGLGTEDRVRVVRNVRVHESTHGLLGGTTHVDHHIEVEASSSLAHSAELEVLERVPVTDDEDLAVSLLDAHPTPTAYDQQSRGEPVRGGKRFRLKLAPGEVQRIRYSYRIELPSKQEVVGGNRRE